MNGEMPLQSQYTKETRRGPKNYGGINILNTCYKACSKILNPLTPNDHYTVVVPHR